MTLPKYDDSQWLLRQTGETVTIKSLIYGKTWEVSPNNVLKILEQCDSTAINHIFSVPCPCVKTRTSCISEVNPSVIFEARIRFIETSKDKKVETLALLLSVHNRPEIEFFGAHKKKKNIHYWFGDKPVCRNFYQRAYNLSKKMLDHVSRETLGDHSWKFPTVSQVTVKLPTYQRNLPHFRICVAFWADFMRSLCPSPKEGIYFFPVDLPMKSIHAIFFVDWFLSVHKGVMSHFCHLTFPNIYNLVIA